MITDQKNTTQKVVVKDDATEKRTKCEVWTRVMGYHRPVSQFNKGKKSEHGERKHFSQKVSVTSSFGASC